MSRMVEWSVMECNRLYGHMVKPMQPCPQCGQNEWKTRWGIDPQFKSEYNPGEYCEFTCNHCGYSAGPQQS